MKLEPHEKQSPVWLKIKKDCEERLAHLRAKNDSLLPPDQTQHIRGQIAECKRILDFEKEDVVIPK